MKTFSFALSLLATIAFVLAGCSDGSSPPVSPSIQAKVAPSQSPREKPVHLATGALDTYFEGKPQSWFFTARQYADGSCDGEYQIYIHSRPWEYSFVHGSVTSLKVYNYMGGKAAIIGGSETKSSYAGFYDAFLVLDSGEGEGPAVVDLFTTYIFSTDVLTDAQRVWYDVNPDELVQEIINTTQPGLQPGNILVPVEMGNVQVR